MDIRKGENGALRSRGWHLVRIGAAVLLLTAATLKCWQLATEPIIETGLLNSRWLLMVAVEFELFLAVLLLSNVWARPIWTLALVCFSVFACISLYKALSGDASCGCFGRVPVNPWYTTALDLLVIAAFMQWRPAASFIRMVEDKDGSQAIPYIIQRTTAVLVMWLAGGLPAAYVMGSYRETTLSDAGVIIGTSKVVVLRPETWLGKRFPLLNYIDIGEHIQDGKWMVLLYRNDCPNCHKVIENLRRRNLPNSEELRVALIQVPPFGETKKRAAAPGLAVRFGHLNEVQDWIVTTPMEAWLDGGRVTAVMFGDGSQNER